MELFCLSSDICIFQTYCVLGTELNHWGIFGITIAGLLNNLGVDAPNIFGWCSAPNNNSEVSEGVGVGWYYGEKAAVSRMSTVWTLLEEELPSAGPDVAEWVTVTRDWVGGSELQEEGSLDG